MCEIGRLSTISRCRWQTHHSLVTSRHRISYKQTAGVRLKASTMWHNGTELNSLSNGTMPLPAWLLVLASTTTSHRQCATSSTGYQCHSEYCSRWHLLPLIPSMALSEVLHTLRTSVFRCLISQVEPIFVRLGMVICSSRNENSGRPTEFSSCSATHLKWSARKPALYDHQLWKV